MSPKMEMLLGRYVQARKALLNVSWPSTAGQKDQD